MLGYVYKNLNDLRQETMILPLSGMTTRKRKPIYFGFGIFPNYFYWLAGWRADEKVYVNSSFFVIKTKRPKHVHTERALKFAKTFGKQMFFVHTKNVIFDRNSLLADIIFIILGDQIEFNDSDKTRKIVGNVKHLFLVVAFFACKLTSH